MADTLYLWTSFKSGECRYRRPSQDLPCERPPRFAHRRKPSNRPTSGAAAPQQDTARIQSQAGKAISRLKVGRPQYKYQEFRNRLYRSPHPVILLGYQNISRLRNSSGQGLEGGVVKVFGGFVCLAVVLLAYSRHKGWFWGEGMVRFGVVRVSTRPASEFAWGSRATRNVVSPDIWLLLGMKKNRGNRDSSLTHVRIANSPMILKSL